MLCRFYAWGHRAACSSSWPPRSAHIRLRRCCRYRWWWHYGFAAIFITPLTILLAEAATLGSGSPAALIEARFFDTVLGCFVGLAGGVCLHDLRFRAIVGQQIRRLIPARLVR